MSTCAARGTTMTLHGAWPMVHAVVLPITSRLKPFFPCRPMMIMVLCCLTASSTMYL